MKTDIEKINTFVKRNKVYTTQWRRIYEVVEEAYFEESEIFPDDLIKYVGIMQMKILIYHLR